MNKARFSSFCNVEKEFTWRRYEQRKKKLDPIMMKKHRAYEHDAQTRHRQQWLEKHHMRKKFDFTADEIRLLKKWFKTIDTDDSGGLSFEELEDTFLTIGAANDRKDVENMLKVVDSDESGAISFEEFLQALTPSESPDQPTLAHLKSQKSLKTLKHTISRQDQSDISISTQLSVQRRHFLLQSIVENVNRTKASAVEQLRLHQLTALREKQFSHASQLMKYRAELRLSQIQNQARFDALKDIITENALKNRKTQPPQKKTDFFEQVRNDEQDTKVREERKRRMKGRQESSSFSTSSSCTQIEWTLPFPRESSHLKYLPALQP